MLVDTGEARIFVSEAGAGPALLLIHGLGMSGALWFNQIPAFSARFRTVAVDLRGFGQSSRPQHAGAYAIEVLATDISAVIDELGLAPCHVLGTSMGGFVAQALALARPDLCRSLLLCHTAPRMSIPSDVLEARVRALETMSMDEYAAIVVEQALAPGATEELCGWLHGMVAANDKQIYAQVLTEGLRSFDVAGALPKVALPSLVVIGEHDRVLPPDGGRELARLINCAELIEIEGAGHLGYAEQPAIFNAAVLDFLVRQ